MNSIKSLVAGFVVLFAASAAQGDTPLPPPPGEAGAAETEGDSPLSKPISLEEARRGGSSSAAGLDFGGLGDFGRPADEALDASFAALQSTRYWWVAAGIGAVDVTSRGRIGEGHGPNTNLNAGMGWHLGDTDIGLDHERKLRWYVEALGGIDGDNYRKPGNSSSGWDGDNFTAWARVGFAVGESWGKTEGDQEYLPRWLLKVSAGGFYRYSRGETLRDSFELIRQNTMGWEAAVDGYVYGAFIQTGKAIYLTPWGPITTRDGFFKEIHGHGFVRVPFHADHNDTELRAGRRSRPGRHNFGRWGADVQLYSGHFTAGRNVVEWWTTVGYIGLGQIRQGEIDSRLDGHWSSQHGVKAMLSLRLNAHLRVDLEYNYTFGEKTKHEDQRVLLQVVFADW